MPSNQTSASKLDPIVERAASMSVVQKPEVQEGGGAPFSVFNMLVRGGLFMPPWWSERRDEELRKFWMKGDHISGAVYTMTAKMKSIPFSVRPKNPLDRSRLTYANQRQAVLMNATEWGDGWSAFYDKFIQDMLTQDKGAFAEIIGAGQADGPIQGAPVSIKHLDAARCILTGDPVFPVLYRDDDGKLFKMHYTRVIHISQMKSPKKEMNGVGFCAVSRAVNVAQTLIDILTYKQEKLGSRPHRAVIVTQGGLSPEDISLAFQAAESSMDNQATSRYSKVVAVGERNLPAAALQLVELSKLPDGFDEETSVSLGIASIALAFGVDARELFPAMQSGATRADALLSHLKQRGKGPGDILQAMTHAINHKFLPPDLEIVFEFQDDAEDRQSAEIRATRAQRRERDLAAKITDITTERQKMRANGEISDDQYRRMELADGRLPDGRSVLTLVYSEDEPYKSMLNLGVPTPDVSVMHDSADMLERIEKAMSAARAEAVKVSNIDDLFTIEEVIATLHALHRVYHPSNGTDHLVDDAGFLHGHHANGETDNISSGDDRNKPRNESRMRRQNLLAPNPKEELDVETDRLKPGPDESDIVKTVLEDFQRVMHAIEEGVND